MGKSKKKIDTRIQCSDCSNLVEKRCKLKNKSVNPAKKRHCSVFNSEGTHISFDPENPMYLPHMDSRTRRMVNRMLKRGVIPVKAEEEEGFEKTKSFPMPATTATASLVGEKPIHEPMLLDPNGQTFIEGPDSDEPQ